MMFPRPALTLSLTAAALVASSTARAQSEISLPVPGVHQLSLLLIPGVQKELKVDETQAKESRAMATRIQNFMVKSFQEIQTKPPQERLPAFEAMNAKLATDTREGFAAFLKEPQLARMRQISLQERGGMSFAETEVQDKLKMSDNQKSRVRSQVREVFQKLGAMATANPNDQQGLMAKAQAVRQELATTIIGELSPEQKALWKELIGTPFVVDFSQLPGLSPNQPKPATPKSDAPKSDAPATPR